MRQHTTSERIDRLMRELGASVTSEGRIYFTGGVSAVLLGWREMTLDLDLKADPEPEGFFECLPRLKDELDINIELASPDQFVPPLPGWRERCQFIAQYGQLAFYHYDFYGQALSKIERAHARDRRDVARMLQSSLVQPQRLAELFDAVKPLMIRYPALDVEALHSRVSEIAVKGVWPSPRQSMKNADVARLFANLPGADLVTEGLADVASGRESVAGELVKIGSPRLRDCGVNVEVEETDALEADRRLYRLLSAVHGKAAHSQYNALIRQLVSFERALEQRILRTRRLVAGA